MSPVERLQTEVNTSRPIQFVLDIRIAIIFVKCLLGKVICLTSARALTSGNEIPIPAGYVRNLFAPKQLSLDTCCKQMNR